MKLEKIVQKEDAMAMELCGENEFNKKNIYIYKMMKKIRVKIAL